MTRKIVIIAFLILVPMLAGTSVVAQHMPPSGPPPDPLSRLMVPPEVVFHHQKELGLTEEQIGSIRREIESVHSRFPALQMEVKSQVDALASLVANVSTGEDQVLAQLDKVLAAEREIKRTHIGLILRIRKLLTPEQLNKLHELMREKHGSPMH